LALKISDGNARAVPAVTAAALKILGVDANEEEENTFGGGKPVGTIRATF
jgi:L-asparaginase II